MINNDDGWRVVVGLAAGFVLLIIVVGLTRFRGHLMSLEKRVHENGSSPLQSGKQRKKIETRFAEVKRNLGLTRLRLRGPTGARDEFLLTATIQNLKRLAKLAAIPPPRPIAA